MTDLSLVFLVGCWMTDGTMVGDLRVSTPRPIKPRPLGRGEGVRMIKSDCWVWDGDKNSSGYGLYEGKLLHRLSYMHNVGQIPPGMVIDHLCRTRACYNPEHLEAVTELVNISRGNKRSSEYAKDKYGRCVYWRTVREDSYCIEHALCVRCGARDEIPCRDKNGKVMKAMHASRRRLIESGKNSGSEGG